jgi:hypothetical protein
MIRVTSAAPPHRFRLPNSPPSPLRGWGAPTSPRFAGRIVIGRCIVAGWSAAPLLLIASLCIVAGWSAAPLLLIASLCIVAGAVS